MATKSDKRATITVNSDSVRYQPSANQYTFQMQHRKPFPWWIFLFLLPLLLLIRCQKDITVRCLDADTGTPLSGEMVLLECPDTTLSQPTDSAGVTVFRNLPTSVFGMVFHPMAPVSASVKSTCHEETKVVRKYYFTRRITLKMKPRRVDLIVKVLDLETEERLPDATVYYEWTEGGKPCKDSTHTDAAGLARLYGMRYCGRIRLMQGSCYGYADTTVTDIPCQPLMAENDSTALRLRPIKDRFSFFVKNKETREPIPDALCHVTLTHPGQSHHVVDRHLRTSIDGKGAAFFDDAFILAVVNILASKPHYKDGRLEGGPWTVENFIQQDEDTRTVWLEPEPYLMEFINVDSLTLSPIPGVKNEITVTDPNGEVTHYTEISNSNGVFPITAKEDSRVDVVSTKDGEYLRKETHYPKFREITDYRIKMMPELVELSFRTVREEDHSVLLPQCRLNVRGSISGHLAPENSGDGVFTVTMRKAERLSIVASKPGYVTNSHTVRDRDWPYLEASLQHRTIPLKLDLPPCNGGVEESYEGPTISIRSYSMGQLSGTASIWVDFFSIGDYLTVYDGNSTQGRVIVPRQFIEYQQLIPFSFTQGAVTVVIESGSGSSGKFEVRCPR